MRKLYLILMYISKFTLIFFLFSVNSCLASDLLSLDEVFQNISSNHPKLYIAELELSKAQAKIMHAQSKFVPRLQKRALFENYKDQNNQPQNHFLSSTELSWQTPWAVEVVGGIRATTDNSLPQDAITYRHTRSSLDSIKKTEFSPSNKHETLLGLRIPLLNGLITDQARTDLKLSKQEVPLAQLQYKKIKNELFRKAGHQYYDLVFALREYQLYQNLINLQTKQRQWTHELVAAGSLAEISKIEIESIITNSQARQQQIKRKCEQAKISLEENLWNNTSIDLNYIKSPNLPTINHINQLTQSERNLYINKQPAYQQLNFKIKQQKITELLAKQNLLPKIDFELMSLQDLDNLIQDISVLASVNISLPLIQLEARSQLQTTKASIAQIHHLKKLNHRQFNNLILDSESKINNSYHTYQSLYQSTQALEKLVQAEFEKYKLGSSDLLKVNIRQENLLKSQIKLNEVIKSNAKAWIDYQYSTALWIN